MEPDLKKSLERITGGIFMMTLFTAIWIGIVENSLRDRDYCLIGILFSVVIITFVSYYIKFVRIAKKLPIKKTSEKSVEEKKQGKWFGIIFALEGLAILILVNVLNNLQLSAYFIPGLALIVGLHFFPLGYLFKRTFLYLMGILVCLVAFTGIVLTHKHSPDFIVITFVGVGSALATTAYGMQMIFLGRRISK